MNMAVMQIHSLRISELHFSNLLTIFVMCYSVYTCNFKRFSSAKASTTIFIFIRHLEFVKGKALNLLTYPSSNI